MYHQLIGAIVWTSLCALSFTWLAYQHELSEGLNPFNNLSFETLLPMVWDVHLITMMLTLASLWIAGSLLGIYSINKVYHEIKKKDLLIDSLIESERRFHDLANNVDEWIWEVDSNGVYTYVSSHVSDILGYDSKDMVGTFYHDYYLPEEKVDMIIKAKELFREKKPIKNFLKKNVHKDGRIVICETNGVPIFDDEGAPTGYRGSDRDITKRIENQNIIKQSLKEKEALLSEIHHRVKNNMQLISSLLTIQARSMSDDKVKMAFNDSINRIKSMSIVHEKLYRSDQYSDVDFEDYIKELIHGYARPGLTINLNVDIEHLSIDDAVPCGLILNELLANASKHAFPDIDTGTINIEFKGDSEGLYKLIVSDNGIGIDNAIKISREETFGLYLVQLLASQLEGKMLLEPGDGTTIITEFYPNRENKFSKAPVNKMSA
jgi:PAS domain S-box-containing protein